MACVNSTSTVFPTHVFFGQILSLLYMKNHFAGSFPIPRPPVVSSPREQRHQPPRPNDFRAAEILSWLLENFLASPVKSKSIFWEWRQGAGVREPECGFVENLEYVLPSMVVMCCLGCCHVLNMVVTHISHFCL